MYLLFGHQPGLNVIRALCAVSIMVAPLVAVNAQVSVPLTLAEAEDIALAAEPGQIALQAKATALAERAVVAAQLPDPQLRMGINNYPVDGGSFSREGMTHALVGVQQKFPPRKTRSINARRMNSLAGRMDNHSEARARDVLLAVRNSWLELYHQDRVNELVRESRPFFEELASATRSLYAVGRKSQQDVLRAELEVSRLDDRLIEIERKRARARAALAEWLGHDSARPLADKLPRWNQVPGLAVLHDALADNPVELAAEAESDASDAGVDLARQRSKPGWALSLGYSYREGNLPNGESRSDFISLGVTVDLPFFRSKSVDSTLTAALSEQTAAKANAQAVQRRLKSRLDAEYAHWHELTRRQELYEQRILLQTREHVEAALLAYQSDNADFADVMRACIDDLNTRIEHIRLQVDRAQSYAALANLGGLPR